MVTQFYDRNGCLCGHRRKREWPKQQPSVRLENWFKRVAKSSAFMRSTKRSTRLRLKASVALGLGLSSPDVTIVTSNGTVELRSEERDVPLSVISQ